VPLVLLSWQWPEAWEHSSNLWLASSRTGSLSFLLNLHLLRSTSSPLFLQHPTVRLQTIKVLDPFSRSHLPQGPLMQVSSPQPLNSSVVTLAAARPHGEGGAHIALYFSEWVSGSVSNTHTHTQGPGPMWGPNDIQEFFPLQRYPYSSIMCNLGVSLYP
jgi:hypothetical protein